LGLGFVARYSESRGDRFETVQARPVYAKFKSVLKAFRAAFALFWFRLEALNRSEPAFMVVVQRHAFYSQIFTEGYLFGQAVAVFGFGVDVGIKKQHGEVRPAIVQVFYYCARAGSAA